MRLRKGYLVLPYEKVLFEAENRSLYKIAEKIVELLKKKINVYVLLEPVVAKISINNRKYNVVLSIGSLIMSSVNDSDSILEYMKDKLWSITEDVWAKASSLSINTGIYVYGFNQAGILNAYRDIVDRIESTTGSLPFVSLEKNPRPHIAPENIVCAKPRIKLLRPGHIVVVGLKEISSSIGGEIETYEIDMDKILREPVDVLASIDSRPFILESLRTKSIFVLGKNIGRYSSKLEDLLLYNIMTYMLSD